MEWINQINLMTAPTLGEKKLSDDDQGTITTTAPYWVDGDTLDKDGVRYRLAGFDTPEIQKVIMEGKGAGTHKLGTPGGLAAIGILSKLAADTGYTNLVPVLDTNGKPQKDVYDRILANLVNDAGESFRQKVLEGGVMNVGAYSSNLDTVISGMGVLDRLNNPNRPIEDEWDQARSDIIEAELRDGKYSLGLRKTAETEAELAAANEAGFEDYYQQSTVNIRSRDRTLTNESLHPLKDSFAQGWYGVLEGGAGFLEAIGEGADLETLADIGEEGVSRYRAKLDEYGTTLTDFRDIEGFWSGTRWLTNNAAISIPYMAATVGGLVLGNIATPVLGTIGGVAFGLTAPAAIFAGNTYNEMEGEKSTSAALLSGITQATLDRLGLHAIFRKGVMPKQLIDEAIEALIKKQDAKIPTAIRRNIAEAQVAQASKREMAAFVGDASKIAKKQIAAKNLFKMYGMRLTAGGGAEALTETGQEVANYLAATHGSDRPFDMEELNRRVIQAAVTGGALGMAFSTPSAVTNHVAWADVAFGKTASDGTEVGWSNQFAEKYKKKWGVGTLPTNESNASFASEKVKEETNKIETRAWEILEKKNKKKGGAIVQRNPKTGKFQSLNTKSDYDWTKKPVSSGAPPTFTNTLSKDTFTKEEYQDAYDQAAEELGFRSIVKRADDHSHLQEAKGGTNRVVESLKMFPKMFKSSVNYTFNKDRLDAGGDAAVELRDIVGLGTSKVFNGSAWESDKIAQMNKMLSITISPVEYYMIMLGKNQKRTQKNMNKASEELSKIWWSAVDKNGDFNPDLIPDTNPNKAFIVLTIERMNLASDKSLEKQNDQALKDATVNGIPDPNFKPIEKEKNYFLKRKEVDANIVRKLKPEFIKALRTNGKTETEANEMYEAVVSKGILDLDEAFSVTQGEISPGYKRSRSLRMSEKPEFKPFLEQNIFKNVETYAKSQARYLSHAKFLGKDARIISQKLNEIEKNFLPAYGKDKAKLEVDRMAFELHNIFNAESGNYKRAKTKDGKKVESITRSYLLVTTLAGLSLSAITSFVELALTGRSFRAEQIDTVLRAQGVELATLLKRGMGEIANVANKATGATPHLETAMYLSNGQRIINLLGYGDYSLGAATTTGVTEINVWQQNIMKGFFKWNGLQGWTNYTRAVRAAIATDFINDKLKTIADYSYLVQQDNLEVGKPNAADITLSVNDEIVTADGRSFSSLDTKEIDIITKEVTQAKEYLRNLGMDVETFVDFYMRYQLNIEARNREQYKIIANPKSSQRAIVDAQKAIIAGNAEVNKTSDILIDNSNDLYYLTPDELEFRNDQLREAVFNFVNEAVALPMAMNRPLIYQDPRFALFTQFQGFMATFTANHLKKMWDEGVVRGSPSMRYSTFITVGSMIMLGFASQALKDWIKYEDGENEYLDNAQWIQRGVRSSGLLGTYERVIDQFMPLYPQGKRGDTTIGNWVLSSVASESPGISNLKRMITGTSDIVSGDIKKGTKKWFQSAPIVGSVNHMTDSASDAVAKVIGNVKF